jgi:ABC-type multidrug transport system ATPase subunit
MITGELPITAGDIFVDGISVSKNIEKVHKNIGYW